MVALYLSSSTVLFIALMMSMTLASVLPQRNILLRDGASSDEANGLTPHQNTPATPESPHISGPVVAVTQNTGNQPAPAQPAQLASVSESQPLTPPKGTRAETALQNITSRAETLTMGDRVQAPPIASHTLAPRDNPMHVGISKNRVEFAHQGKSFDMSSQGSDSKGNGLVNSEYHRD